MEPIFVTGATGKIGGAVAAELLSRGVPVRAFVRAVDARSDQLRSKGAQIVVGDIFDYDSLLHALTGCTRAFYCPPMDPYISQSAMAFALAAADAGTRSIVGLSQWLANPASPALLTRGHWLVDRTFARLPETTFTIVNPGYFADNILGQLIAMAANLGQYPWPYGDSLNAWPSNEDIAGVAVAALLDPARHNGRTYRPTGPKLISGRDVADTLSRVLGRRVTFRSMPEWMFLKAVRAAGFSSFVQFQMVTYNEEQRRGAFAYNAPTDHVLRATGREAEPFEATVARYAALPEAQASFRNRLSALGQLMKIITTPLLDFKRFERLAGLPVAPTPRLSVGDERWRIEHAPRPDVPRICEANAARLDTAALDDVVA